MVPGTCVSLDVNVPGDILCDLEYVFCLECFLKKSVFDLGGSEGYRWRVRQKPVDTSQFDFFRDMDFGEGYWFYHERRMLYVQAQKDVAPR